MLDRQTIIKIILLTLTITGLFIIYTFIKVPLTSVENLQDSLMSVSGILVGIILAYTFSKLFLVKTERTNMRNQLNKLSNKLTTFRKILYVYINSHEFWGEYDDIRKLKAKFPKMTFNKAHGKSNEETQNFWLGSHDFSSTRADLYLAMEQIVGDKDKADWYYQDEPNIVYTEEQILEYYQPSNQIWYYLEGRYAKHTAGRLNENSIPTIFQNSLLNFVKTIDPTFKKPEVDRHVIADIASEFHEKHIPKMHELTINYNKGLPKSIIFQYISLTIILAFGVIVPLILKTLHFSPYIARDTTAICSFIIIGTLINFLFDFYALSVEEIKE